MISKGCVLRVGFLASLLTLMLVFHPPGFGLAPTAIDPVVLEIASALDANGNGRIDDDEIKQATSLWISSEVVTGTDHIITDEILEQLIDLWITGRTLDTSMEFGDAPRPYPSLKEDMGARHLPGHLWLGKGRNFEPNAKLVDKDELDDADYAFSVESIAGASIVIFEANVSADSAYGATVAFLSVLLDLESNDCSIDGWGPGDVVLLNVPMEIVPGTTKRVTLPTPLDELPEGNQWLRITLTPEPIAASGAWDGSTATPFSDGETEDYCEPGSTRSPPDSPPHFEWPVWLKNDQEFYYAPFPLNLILDASPPGTEFEVDPNFPFPGVGVKIDPATGRLVVPNGQLFNGRTLICVKQGGVILFKLWLFFMPHDPVPPPDEPKDPVPPPDEPRDPSPPKKPDLVIDNIVLANGKDGGAIVFKVRVHNQGNAPAGPTIGITETLGGVEPGSCDVVLVVRTASTVGMSEAIGIELVSLNLISIEPLAPNQGLEFMVECKPNGRVFSLRGTVDPEENIDESNEGNNTDNDLEENPRIPSPKTGNQAPISEFNCDIRANQAACDGRKSKDPDGIIVQYLWNFGDGTTGRGPQFNHEYARLGEYTVQLTVVDDEGKTATSSKKIVVGGGQKTAPKNS